MVHRNYPQMAEDFWARVYNGSPYLATFHTMVAEKNLHESIPGIGACGKTVDVNEVDEFWAAIDTFKHEELKREMKDPADTAVGS